MLPDKTEPPLPWRPRPAANTIPHSPLQRAQRLHIVNLIYYLLFIRCNLPSAVKPLKALLTKQPLSFTFFLLNRMDIFSFYLPYCL